MYNINFSFSNRQDYVNFLSETLLHLTEDIDDDLFIEAAGLFLENILNYIEDDCGKNMKLFFSNFAHKMNENNIYYILQKLSEKRNLNPIEYTIKSLILLKTDLKNVFLRLLKDDKEFSYYILESCESDFIESLGDDCLKIIINYEPEYFSDLQNPSQELTDYYNLITV
jgi:hypothetical protein